MLTPELESRMSKIIEKLDKLQTSEKKESEDNFLSEQEKYEYLIQKNAQKRVSQNFEKISDFFNRENEEETEEDDADELSQENESSMALNMKKLITIGEFQISLDKLLELLEESLNIKENNDVQRFFAGCAGFPAWYKDKQQQGVVRGAQEDIHREGTGSAEGSLRGDSRTL
jgi:hypothetical protein